MSDKKKKTLGNVFNFDDEDKKIGAIKTKNKGELVDEFVEPKKDKRTQISIYVYESYIDAIEEKVDDIKRQARKDGKEVNISRNRLIEHIFEQYLYGRK